jgi:hypothetical protein
MKRWGVTILVVAMALAFSVKAGEPAGTWQLVESRYFRIYYQDAPDLVRLTYHLTRGKDKARAQRIKRSQTVQPEELKIYDELYEDTMRLLGMRSSERLAIRIYPDYEALAREYERLARKKDPVIAFYNQRNDAICVDASATRSVIGHEMAHALTDKVFMPDPPLEVQELLAGYVQTRI